MNPATIPLFDYILLAVLILFVVHGLWVGFFRQLPFVIALIGSYAASALYAGEFMPHLAQVTESPKGIFGGSFLVLLIVLTLLLKLIGKLLGKIIQVKVVGWGNRLFLGAPLALAKALALVILLVMFLAASLPPADHFFRDSLIDPYLEQGSGMARSVIQDAEIRKDLRPRKAPVGKKEGGQQILQEEMPLNAAPQQARPSEEKDDPASSTEIVR